MRPGIVGLFTRRHFDGDLTRLLPLHGPLDGEVVFVNGLLVAIGQAKAPAVVVDVDSEIFEPRHAVQNERSFVGGQDRFVEADEDDPVIQSGDQLLQLPMFSPALSFSVFHRRPFD